MKRLLGLAVSAVLLSSTTQAESLSEIYELALQNDPTFQAAQATYLIDQERIYAPRKALLPGIAETASVSYSIDQKSETRFGAAPASTLNPMGTAPGETSNRNGGGNKSYQLSGLSYSFNVRNWFDFKSAEYSTEQAESQFALEQQALIVRVVGTYLDVLRADESLQIAKANENESKRRLQNAKERFAVGLVSITDVHQAQATYDNAVVAVLQASGEFAIRFEALEVLTGQRHFEVAALKDDFPVDAPSPANREEWVEFALQNSNNLKAAKLARDAAVEAAKGAKLNYTPTVKVEYGGYTKNSNTGYTQNQLFLGDEIDFNNPANREEKYGGGSISVSVPVFTWGLNASERRVAAQQQIQAHENYVNARRSTVQDTRSSYLSAKTDAARVKALASAVTSAQSAYEATQAGYEVGTQNILDVLAEQTRLFTAQQNYANARYDYINSLLNLKLQAGQLNPDDVYALNEWLDEADIIKKEQL